MKLKFLTVRDELVDLRPNSPTRDWMDQTEGKYAYRCLPLNIANAHGWSFHFKSNFMVHWNGENSTDSITIKSDDDVSHVVRSIFGNGIVTFHTHGVFQTEAGWNIMASGPANNPKDGISPLSGIIETDWSPYSFTMNWKITRPWQWIRFNKGEPFCSIFPVQRNVLEDIEPELWPIDSDSKLYDDFARWTMDRRKFNYDLNIEGSDAQKEKWQKSYYQGKRPDGNDGVKDHIIKLRLKEFQKKFKEADPK